MHFAVVARAHVISAHFEHGRSEGAEEGVLVVGVGLHELHCDAGSGLQDFVREEEPLARHQILVVLVVEADRRAGVQICRHVPVAVLRAQVLQLCEIGFLQRRIRLARVSLVKQSRLEARAARFADCVRACEIKRVKIGTGKRDDISLIEPHGVEAGDELGDVEARFGNGVCSGVLARRERITSSQLHIPERATTLQPTRAIIHVYQENGVASSGSNDVCT